MFVSPYKDDDTLSKCLSLYLIILEPNSMWKVAASDGQVLITVYFQKGLCI